MRSIVAIDVAAPADLVFDLVCDVERWADLLPHYVSVRRMRTPGARSTGAAAGVRRPPSVPSSAAFARYVAIRPIVGPLGLGLPIVWRSYSWPDPDRRHLHFVHEGGATGGMEVVWTIEPAGEGSHVSIEHSLAKRLPIPLLGRLAGDELLPEVVDRFVIRSVAGQTLASLRAIAEALADPRRAPADSDRRSGT